MTKELQLTAALLVLCSTVVEAQSDTTLLGDARRKTIDVYTKSIDVQSHLYNGSEYREYISQEDEFPYLYDDTINGNVKYSGNLYEDVPLDYDLSTDQVITSYPYGSKIQLVREKVEYFEISGHHFVRLNNDKVPEGFYDVLYDGKMKFYVRRQKNLVLKISGKEAQNLFEDKIRYYIVKDGFYHTVKSKKSVMNLLSDRKKELKRMLKQQGIKFGQSRELAITRLLEHYEQTK